MGFAVKRVAILALLLAGCVKPVPPPAYVPPLLICEPRCKQACDTSEPPKWAPPDPAAPGAWDLIRPQVVAPLRSRLAVCEEHRRACVACLEEAERQGIVVSQEP